MMCNEADDIQEFTFDHSINHTYHNGKLFRCTLFVLRRYHWCVLSRDLDCACAEIREVRDKYMLAERGVPNEIIISVSDTIN